MNIGVHVYQDIDTMSVQSKLGTVLPILGVQAEILAFYKLFYVKTYTLLVVDIFSKYLQNFFNIINSLYSL